MTVAILGLTSCEGDPILNNEIPPTASIIADAVAVSYTHLTLPTILRV